MRNGTIWQACELYGEHLLESHKHPTVFKRWLSNFRELETQLMCDDKGEPIEGTKKFTDGDQTWGPIRWPYKAETDHPEWYDRQRQFLFDDHLLAIGSTGWNWERKESWWLGFDFDSITGHAENVGVKDAELEAVVRSAPDYVDVVRSTRGSGKHLYIFFDQNNAPKTNNHDEHSALARAFLQKMAMDVNFDFDTRMDVCGMILWIWHRNMSENGFELVRESKSNLSADDVPANWRDHLDMIGRGRSKVRVRGWAGGQQLDGEDVDASTKVSAEVPLDATHKKLLNDLEGTGYSVYWVADHHLLQTHTRALLEVYEQWEEAGGPMRGPFNTNSPDTDPGKPNCFLRPKQDGAWDVFRFGRGVAECELWEEVNGNTRTTLNSFPSLSQCALASGGVECSEAKDGYQLGDVEQLNDALKYLGFPDKFEDAKFDDRTFGLKTRADGKIVLKMEKKKTDEKSDFVGWENKRTAWSRVLGLDKATGEDDASFILEWDEKIRAVKSPSSEGDGEVSGSFDRWLLKDSSGKWVKHPKENIGFVLAAEGLPGPLHGKMLGTAIMNAWVEVNRPFEPQYPGGRQWNYNAAQLRYQPAKMKDGEFPSHPHWDLIFNHCGTGLDSYINDLEWCDDWQIRRGGDYLKAWVGAMIRFPYKRLPYLFMYSPAQNTGKSTFHEAVDILLTKGVVKADRALTSSQDFNGELATAILGVIDEADIARAGRAAYNKIKEWTTGLTLSVHAKYKEVYQQRSTLHLIQMANSRASLPVFPGDSRITSMEVPQFEKEVGKDELMDALHDEAPHFMRTLMDLQMPTLNQRWRIPVIETQDKMAAIAANRNSLEEFIDDVCVDAPGEMVSFKEFCDTFTDGLEKHERSEWNRTTIRRGIPSSIPVGKWSGNKVCVGNISFDCDVETDIENHFTLESGRLIKNGVQG